MHRWRSSHCSDSTDCMSDESEVDLDTVRQSVKLRRRVVVFSRTSRASYDSGETSEEVDLPDGCCHRKPTHLWNAPGPPKQSETSAQHDSKTGYLCEYVGSFSVTDNESWCRPELMDAQLARMRCEPSKRSVLFLVTASGVKICCADDKVVLMAHAVRRICWCTCSPGQHQFAFLAREPKLRAGLQHCHVFRARSPKQVGAPFRDMYAFGPSWAATEPSLVLLAPVGIFSCHVLFYFVGNSGGCLPGDSRGHTCRRYILYVKGCNDI